MRDLYKFMLVFAVTVVGFAPGSKADTQTDYQRVMGAVSTPDDGSGTNSDSGGGSGIGSNSGLPQTNNNSNNTTSAPISIYGPQQGFRGSTASQGSNGRTGFVSSSGAGGANH